MTTNLFEWGLFAVATLAGSIASITGFGIGSLITPVLSLSVQTDLAVALVAIPHLIGTTLRFWMLRRHVNFKVFWHFGIMSAIGGLSGALMQTYFAGPSLTVIFGVILLLAGVMSGTALSQWLKLKGPIALLAGGLSGVLGGLVGNQGGIRSAALLNTALSKNALVATATAIGLVVDGARMPIYFWKYGDQILQNAHWTLLTTGGVLLGTWGGAKLLKKLPEQAFRKAVSSVIFILGAAMVYRGWV